MRCLPRDQRRASMFQPLPISISKDKIIKHKTTLRDRLELTPSLVGSLPPTTLQEVLPSSRLPPHPSQTGTSRVNTPTYSDNKLILKDCSHFKHLNPINRAFRTVHRRHSCLTQGKTLKPKLEDTQALTLNL